MSAISLALLSTSNLQLFAGELRRELRAHGWDAKIWQSGFNQYRQDIWNAGSGLYASEPQAVILHLDGEDLFADALKNPFTIDTQETSRNAAADLESAIDKISEHLPDATIIVNTIFLPPRHALTGLEYNTPFAIGNLAAIYNAELKRIAAVHSNVLVHDVGSLVALVGYQRWFDPRLWYLARCRLSNEAMKALAESTASLLLGWRGETKKCIVVDLDNTLWGGIVGEDGMEGIVLGEEGIGLAYAEFQDELVNLTRKGILLAICSKNNEDDALTVLRRHPSMRVREEHLAAWRINWQDKATNLRELAGELNIGLDSFVFLDDNPAERSLIRASLPEVVVPEWPDDPSAFKAALLAVAARHFMKVSLTAEDRDRTSMYRGEGQRRKLAASTACLDDYYRSLEMRARIGPADSFSIPRIAQLTLKTNQFNLTTRRYTEAEIRTLASANDAVVLWLSLSDRFSDNGIVGVLILRQRSARQWEIDTFLMSCRIIGRTVENAFLGHACQALLERGAKELIGEYIATKKNGLAANIYRDLGFEPFEDRWRLALDEKPVAIPEWIDVEVAEALHA